MKKNIFFITFFFLLLFSYETISQISNIEKKHAKWVVGIELGPNITHTTRGHFFNGAERLKTIKLGLSGGISFQYFLKSHFSIMPSIVYERKIIAEKISIFNPTTNKVESMSCNSKFNYITFPILARYYINKNTIFFDTGISLDFLFKSSYTYYNFFLNEDINVDNTRYSTKFNVNIVAGLGINIPIRKKYDLSFELRDNLGLLNINKDGTIININSICFIYTLYYKIPNMRRH